MPSLREQIGSGDKRSAVVEDGMKVLDEEVGEKSGLSGIAIKGAYKIVQGVRPGFIREAVNHLLDDFLDAMNPIYQEAAEKKQPAGAYLRQNSARVAQALLAVTDQRAARVESQIVKKTYEKLRPMAQKQVEGATPRLATLIEKHAAPTN
jgi:hypothetical protein